MTKFKKGDTAILTIPKERIRHEEWLGKMVVIVATHEDEDNKKYGLEKGWYLCNIINLSDYEIINENDLSKCDLFRNSID